MTDIQSPLILVQNFGYGGGGGSNRRKGAAEHVIDMVWLYRSLSKGGGEGVYCLLKLFLTAFAAP
jgi:hypothetical protein